MSLTSRLVSVTRTDHTEVELNKLERRCDSLVRRGKLKLLKPFQPLFNYNGIKSIFRREDIWYAFYTLHDWFCSRLSHKYDLSKRVYYEVTKELMEDLLADIREAIEYQEGDMMIEEDDADDDFWDLMESAESSIELIIEELDWETERLFYYYET